MNKALIIAMVALLTGCADTKKVVLTDTDTNCRIDSRIDKNIIVCPDGSELEVPEIEPIEGATIVSFIYPCQDTSNNQELLIRLSDGSILGIFDGDTSNNPGQTRLVELAPGNYITTDQNNTRNRCRFTITEEGEVTPSLEVEIEGLNKGE